MGRSSSGETVERVERVERVETVETVERQWRESGDSGESGETVETVVRVERVEREWREWRADSRGPIINDPLPTRLPYQFYAFRYTKPLYIYNNLTIITTIITLTLMH